MNTYQVTQINVPDFERKVFEVKAEEVEVDGNYVYFIKGGVFCGTTHNVYSNVESVVLIDGDALEAEEKQDAESEES